MGGATKLFRKYGNLQVPRTWRNWHAEPTFAPPKVAVLTVVQVSDAWSAHRTFWLSDQLSVRSYEPRRGADVTARGTRGNCLLVTLFGEACDSRPVTPRS